MEAVVGPPNGDPDKGCDHEKLSCDTIAPEDGSYYVYFSNESEKVWEVFFDDFKVTLDQKYVSETTDFYPFSLVMRQSRFNTEESYRFGYQGQFSEEDDETGWNSFELRMYDAVIGRWNAVDPYRQFSSPYIGMGNNPVYYYDPNGGCVDSNNNPIPCPEGIPEAGNEYTLIAGEMTFEHEVSGFESFLDMLYNWSNEGGGFEFYNTGTSHGEPLYWVRNGKAYGAYYDVSDNMIVFGKLGDRKAFPKGHMPTTKNWASTSKVNAEGFKDLLDGAQLGGGVKEKVINVIIKTSTAPHQGLTIPSDTGYSEHYRPFGVIKRKSNRFTGEIYSSDTVPNK